jgi:predicted nuclease with TOPRIM domain
MSDEKVQELLLKLIEDVATINAKLDSINEQRLASRLDLIEAQTREQERVIKGLENRNSKLEEYVRNNLVEHEKANKGLWTSLGLAMFSVVLTVITTILF